MKTVQIAEPDRKNYAVLGNSLCSREIQEAGGDLQTLCGSDIFLYLFTITN